LPIQQEPENIPGLVINPFSSRIRVRNKVGIKGGHATCFLLQVTAQNKNVDLN
jgi:hypothetical protein